MTTSSTTSDLVLNHYSSIAQQDITSNTEHIKNVAESFGYSPEDLVTLPHGANLGLSCGNPLTIAGIKPGETIIDLGSGAGFDVFQAAYKVGPAGHAIGIDTSIHMINRAKANATKASITNVSFILAPITAVPLPDKTADCIISNCVLNLLPPAVKPVCFNEIYRLLKPGGRLAVSDVLAKKPLTPEMQADIGLYVGCISGASLVHEYRDWMKDAGSKDIMLVDKHVDLNIYKERNTEDTTECCETTDESIEAITSPSSCCTPEKREVSETPVKTRAAEIDFNEWVSSHSIYALKPNAA